MIKPGVIQIIDSLNTGGAEVLAVNIANGLYEKGINSHICATREEGKLLNNINKNVGYIFIKRSRTVDLSAFFVINNYLKIHNIKIIHAHATSSFFAFCIKLLNPNIKLIWHDHYGKSEELEKRKIFPLNLFSYFFNTIISVNTKLKIWSQKKLNCKNVFFINNFPIFNNFEKITVLKGIDKKRVVHLAAFREQKDHINLINAFEIFINDKKDWSLHLVGQIGNDKYSNEVLSLIKNKRLEKHIFVYGARLDILNILKQATIGILSSISEGLPIALLEYGLAELPVIVTDVGECSKVVKNNISGIVVKPKNKDELYQALKMISNSDEIKINFSKELNDTILKNYSDEVFFEKIINIYKT